MKPLKAKFTSFLPAGIIIYVKIFLGDKRNAGSSVAAGIVGMCITGQVMELWETLFAGCGKAVFAFPCAVNSVFHGEMGSYAYFHDASFKFLGLVKSVLRWNRQSPCCLLY